MATSSTNNTDLNEEQENNLNELLDPLYDDLDDEYKPSASEGNNSAKAYGRLDTEEKAEMVAEIANGETNIDTRIQFVLEDTVEYEDVIEWAEQNYFPRGGILVPDEETMTSKKMRDRDIRNW